MTDYKPTRADRFSFSLSTVQWQRSDVSRPSHDPIESLHRLADLGAHAVSLREEDIIAAGSDDETREKVARRLGETLDDARLAVSSFSTGLFDHPVFADGALTAGDRDIRRYALRQLMRGIDVAAELGAPVFVLSTARERVRIPGAKNLAAAHDRLREGLDVLCTYAFNQGCTLRFALGHDDEDVSGALLPTLADALAMIGTLDDGDRVGVSHRAGAADLTAVPAPFQSLHQGALLHLDLTGPQGPRFDLGLGSPHTLGAFWTVAMLEQAGYRGPRHLGHPHGATDDVEDGLRTAAESMRTYLVLRERVAAFHADPEVARTLASCGATELAVPTLNPRETPEQLRAEQVDIAALAVRVIAARRLNQLVLRHLPELAG